MSSKPPWGRFTAEFRAARTPKGRARFGRVALEGLRVCERALRAGARIEEVLCGAGCDDSEPRRAALLKGLQAQGAQIFRVPDALLAELCAGRDLGRIVALAVEPLAPRLADAFAQPAFALVACDVEEPGNVGALARTALASGAGLFIATGISDPFHPKAIRTSMGSLFRLGVARFPDPVALATELRTLGVRTLAAVARDGTPIEGPVEGPGAGSRKTALYVGSEAFGLSDAVLSTVDERVTISMPEGVDSYSVNAAAAILCWALAR